MLIRIFLSYLFIIRCWLIFSQPHNSINYTIKDGLPSNTVYCVVQDDQGFIWFGTDAGLSRFDGIAFRNYGLRDGLPDMDILNFYKDPKGRIWFFTFNGRIGYLKDGKIYNSKNSENLKNVDFKSRITSIATLEENVFIASLRDGIKVLNSSGVVDSIMRNGIYNYLTVIDDKCYVINLTGSNFIINNVELDESKNELSLTDNRSRHYDQTSNHSLAYVHSIGNHIFCISSSYAYAYLSRFNTSKNELTIGSFDQYKVYNLDKIDDHVYLFTSEGVKILDTESLTASDFIDVNESTDLIIDNEKNTWIPTLNSGVVFFAQSEVKRDGLMLPSVQGLHAFRDSLLYMVHSGITVGHFGTDKALVNQYILPRSYLKSIYVDSSSHIWTLNSVGLRKEGSLIRYESTNTSFQNKGSFIFHKPGILEYKNLVTGEEVLFEYQNLGKIWDFEFVTSDQILIVSSRGLYIMNLSDASIKRFSAYDRFQITSLSLDKYEHLWLATNGHSLLRIKKHLLRELTYEQILDHSITDYSDVFGKILIADSITYATTPKGVSKIKFDEHDILEVSHISESNGIIPARINDLEYFRGKIYIAQDNGLFYFDHDQNFKKELIFPVFIDEMIAGDSTLSVDTSTYLFSHDIETIQINTRAIYFENHKNLSYQFKLIEDGREDIGWSNSPNNEFIFSNLLPGEYTFQVRARATNSSWTAPSTLNFVIENVFWRTLWFKVLCSVMIIMLFLFTYNSYSKAKKKRQTMIKQKMESDLKALKAQINPHFLFNSLNSIQSFILEGDNNLADEYLIKYGKLIRLILNHSNLLTVSIKDELTAIELYIELEKLRFSGALDFNIKMSNVDPQLDKVPSMIIQPLLENAIWHGIKPTGMDGWIKLTFSKKEEYTIVTVEDNGVGFISESLENNDLHGIQLIKDRVELINRLKGKKSSFTIDSDELGTRVRFSYPNDLN